MTHALLTIVIPTHNRKRKLTKLLMQIMRQQLPAFPVTVVVVDDGSTDRTSETVRKYFPEVHLVYGDGHWWFTRSLNEGCRYAVNQLRSSLILTLNDDVKLPAGYLNKLMDSYRNIEKECLLGSSSYTVMKPRRITFSGIKSRSRCLIRNKAYVRPFTLLRPGYLSGYAPSVALPTRGMLVSASILVKLNYFDEEKFPQYASDYDFVMRAGRQGIRAYVSYDAYLYEDTRATSPGSPRLTKGIGHFLRNVFFNRYSSDYFFKDLTMAWRFGLKILMPLHVLRILANIPYVFIKYKFLMNKRVN